MSQYHQGPPFPVSSSPILPLDVQPTRARRPSPLSLQPLRAIAPHAHELPSFAVDPNNQRHLGSSPPDSARPVPADWISDATPVDVDPPRFDPQQRRGSLGSTGTPSPYTPIHPLPSTPIGWNVPLNLVAYAPSFHESSASSSTTFFYRSPTPSVRQRTNQACEKCRDRKTKCSGSRPTCVRCQARGLICEYASEHRIRGPTKSRKRSAPAIDSPTSASPTRATFPHHPYAPKARIDHSVWERPVAAKAPESIHAGTRTSWASSDHSDESNDSGGVPPYKQQVHNSYLGLSGMQGFPSEVPPQQGFNPMDYPFYRPQMTHYSAVNSKEGNLGTPMLRISASMPQLKPAPYNRVEDRLEEAASSPYSTSEGSSNASLEIYASTPESLYSRCPSSSSLTSYSQSSADNQGILSTGESSDTITLESWPVDAALENEHNAQAPKDILRHGGYGEGETPRPLSQHFNVSEWITSADYSEESLRYQFSDPQLQTAAAPES